MAYRVFLTLFLSIVVTLAQPPASKALEPVPPNGKPKPFNVPARETTRLPNGVQANMVQYGTAPLVSISVSVQAGNINETPAEDALADLTAAMMKEGAAGKSSKDLAEAAAALGGSIGLGARPEYTDATMSVLSEFAPQAIKLLADVVQSPDFPASEFERVRAAMLRSAAMSKNQPALLADAALAKALFPSEHAYSRGYLPDEEILRKFTLDDVKRFHAAQFGAARTRIYVVGRFDRTLVKQAIDTAFKEWKRGADPVRNVPAMRASRQVVFVDRPNSEQAVVRVAIPIPLDPTHPDFVPMQVLDAMLGGSFVSRITTNIREEKGYTYSPSSAIQNTYKSAFWVHRSAIANRFAEPGVKEILKEIQKIRAEPPPADELDRIKNETAGLFAIGNASNGGLLSQLQFVDRQGLDDRFTRTYVDRVRAVKREDIQRLAESYLNPAKMTYVIVGDKTKIQSALDTLQ